MLARKLFCIQRNVMVLQRAEKNKILESGLKTSSKFRTWNVYAIVPLISRDLR